MDLRCALDLWSRFGSRSERVLLTYFAFPNYGVTNIFGGRDDAAMIANLL